MSKAIIWCRVSTDAQEWESQKIKLTEKAVNDGFSRDGGIECIGEKGASARKMNDQYQKEVNQLLDKIASDPDVVSVYVWEVSRLARNELAFYQMKDALIRKHIQLICDVPKLQLYDEDGEINHGAELSLNLLVTLAKQEMEIKEKRFARGKEHLAKQGKYNGGAIPYGYKVDKEKDNLIVEDEEEGRIVREIFNMYEHGYSQPSIAKELFARGVKGKAVRGGNKMTISLVHQILTNELLTGKEHKSKGASYPRKYPQIITQEQFDRCRKIAEANNTCLPKSRKVYYAHGLIKCTACGRNFVGTGYKGYYHCQDAYNYNKKYDGYYGIPMCSNKVCISINVLDSLLWNEAIQYETKFIISEATEKIEAYKDKIKGLREKVNAIPSRLDDIERRRDMLLEARADGMKKERFLQRKGLLDKEERETLREKNHYLKEIVQYESLLKQAQEAHALLWRSEGIVDEVLNKFELIEKRLAAIKDDKERSEIIHRHIERITVEKVRIQQTFEKYPSGKEVDAKMITLYPYGKDAQIFFFVPNDGKGGRMLQFTDYYKSLTGEPSHNILERLRADASLSLLRCLKPYSMSYIPRMKDEGKYHRREIVRTQRESLKSQAIDELREQGYISMNEMRVLSKLSYSTIYDAIKHGRLVGINKFKTWYAKASDFQQYLDKYKPQPRPYRQKNFVFIPTKDEEE